MGTKLTMMIGAGAAALMMSSGMAFAGAGDECCAKAEQLEQENNLLKAKIDELENATVEEETGGLDIPGDLSVNAAFSTDYSFRGISQTGNDPALSGGLDWSHDSGFYIGTWTSNIDFSDNTSPELEVDIYGGYAFDYADIGFDLGVVYFLYANVENNDNPELNYFEFPVSASYDFDYFSASVGAVFSPDYFGESGFFAYPNLSVSVPLGVDWLGFDANVGYSFIDDNAAFGTPDYLDYGVALSATLEELVTFSVGYYGTDMNAIECFGGDDRACDDRVIGSVSFSY